MINKKSKVRNIIKANCAITIAFVLVIPIVSVGIKGDNSLDDIIYVDDSNINGPWDGSYSHPFRYIQEGVDHATNGDAIYVRSGYYIIQNTIEIDRSIVLAGEDRDTTNIIASPSLVNIVCITANDASFQWFTLSWDTGIPLMNSVPISVTSQHNHIFGNKIFAGNSRSGIELTSSSGSTVIADNQIYDPYSDGLRLIVSNNNTIEGNTFSITSVPTRTDPGYNYRSFIRVLGSSGNTIEENSLSNGFDDYDGIDLDMYWQSHSIHFSSRNTINGNTISGSGVFGLFLNCGLTSTISGNTITNKNNGIYIVGDNYDEGRVSRNNTITGNTITGPGSGDGMFLWLAFNNTIVGNIVQGFTEGIRTQSYTAHNRIYQNHFINNQYNAYVFSWNQNTWDGGYLYGGNYWSDNPSFVDTYYGPNQDAYGSDSICDTPYTIVGTNIQDRYPLMDPQTNNYVDAIRGTIRYMSLEGGFYGIVADDGRHFYPYNLSNIYRVDGLRIQFSGRIITVINYHMWGEGVYITNMNLPTNIQVFSPNGGEEFHAGQLITIRWFSQYESNNDPGNLRVDCYISTQSGQENTWIYLTGDIDSHRRVNTYTIQLPTTGISGMHCRFLIGAHNGLYHPENIDMSDHDFSIIADPGNEPNYEARLTIISPTGGEIFPAGSSQTLLWETTGKLLSEKVKILVSPDSGKTWTFVSSTKNAMGKNSYQITIPKDQTPTNQFLIKILSTDNKNVYCISNPVIIK